MIHAFMGTLFIAFFFILGLIIGSFLNVVLFRYNTGRGIMGRSKCFSCRRSLDAIDLVPLFSFLVFRGRCRTCKSRISWQYPAVELATGILFAASYFLVAPAALYSVGQFAFQAAYLLIVMSLFVLITVYDMRHKIIPDMFAYAFAGISFLVLFLGFDQFGQIHVVMPSAVSLFSGVILAFPFYFLWLISSGRWMGFGDAKLALGMGWFLGLGAGATAVIFGFWIGAAVSLLLLAMGALSRKYHRAKLLGFIRVPALSMKSEIPFAPFLIAGLLIVFFFGYNMFSVLESII